VPLPSLRCGVSIGRVSCFRREPRLRHYGDCFRCGHDWREHAGGLFGEDACGECRYEQEHEEPNAPATVCAEVAPSAPSTAWHELRFANR